MKFWLWRAFDWLFSWKSVQFIASLLCVRLRNRIEDGEIIGVCLVGFINPLGWYRGYGCFTYRRPLFWFWIKRGAKVWPEPALWPKWGRVEVMQPVMGFKHNSEGQLEQTFKMEAVPIKFRTTHELRPVAMCVDGKIRSI